MHNAFFKPVLLAGGLTLLGVLPGIADTDVRALPMSMTSQLDAGQIVNGHLEEQPIEKKFLQRTSVWLTQEIIVKERLSMRAGVGGLFWYAIPEGSPEGDAAHRALTKLGPGISRVDMSYKFGDLEKPRFTVQAGFFPYKYNSDAKDLGEYLLRSGTYPGVLTSGGWNIISQAGYMMQGVRLNMSLWDGKFQSEFLLPMERDMPPNGDLSPTYIATLAPTNGIEVGAGIACNHCIAVAPSKTSPRSKYTANPVLGGDPGSSYIVENPNFNPDSAITTYGGSNPRYLPDTTRFYTFQGIKLMARASFDPKAFIAMPFLGPQDLRLYTEWALLGVKNHPFFYEKRMERMPVMVGINLPTFRLLDILAFEVEYYGSNFPNSMKSVYDYALPVPAMVDDGGIVTQDANLYDRSATQVRDDNWKWAIYARKEVVRGMRFYVQVANDHLRVPQYTAQNSNLPVTYESGKDWYYLVRFELGI